MIVERKDFSILSDNEEHYFSMLEGIINAVDEYAQLAITHTPTGYNFKLASSQPKLLNLLIQELNTLHSFLYITLNYSKSMKTSSTIDFKINLE